MVRSPLLNPHRFETADRASPERPSATDGKHQRDRENAAIAALSLMADLERRFGRTVQRRVHPTRIIDFSRHRLSNCVEELADIRGASLGGEFHPTIRKILDETTHRSPTGQFLARPAKSDSLDTATVEDVGSNGG